MGEFSLKKSERLSSRKVIDELFVDGNSFLIFPLKVVWKVVDEKIPYPTQVGFAVSKRNFKKAVSRNLLKRRMRESYRLNKSYIHTQLIDEEVQLVIMIIFVGKQILDYSKIENSMKKVLFRLVNEVKKLNNLKK